MIKYVYYLRFLLRYTVLGLLSVVLHTVPAKAQSAPPQAGLGQALQLDGTDDYVAIGGMSYGGSQPAVTVEAWVRTSSAGDQIIASFDESEYWSLETSGGQVVWKVATDAGPLTLSSSNPINSGQWHHVAAVYDNGVATIYIDGVADGTTSLGATFGTGLTRFGLVGTGSKADVFNGLQGPTDFLAGAIDEVRIWDVAQTPAAIEEGRFSQFSGSESNLVLYYDFESESGITVVDRTTNHYDGTLVNTTDANRINGNVTAGSAVPDQVAIGGEEFPNRENNTFPANVFFDTTPITSYDAQSVDGSSLPTWLKFDATRGTFSGTPPNSPDSLSIRLTATDSDGQTARDVFALVVRAVPSVTLDALTPMRGYEITFEEGSPPVDITASQVTIQDLDNTRLTEFNINLLNNINEDSLILRPEGKLAASAAGIGVQEYNAVSGSIILTGLATLSEYAEVLEWVQYVNRLEDPTAGIRIVSFIATDEDGNTGSAASLVTVVVENDSPTLDLNGPNPGSDHLVTYVEGTPPVAIANNNVTLSDIDYHHAGSMTVTITNRPDTTQEILEVIGSLPVGIIASFNDSTGVMELSGAASMDDYEKAIQQIGYRNASKNPNLTQRTLMIVFDDGDGGESTSSAVTWVNIIPVNDPPDTHIDTIIVAEYSLNNMVSATLPTDIDNKLSELTITVVSLPDLGTLTHTDGTPLKVGDVLDSTQFVELQYDTPGNYDGVSKPGRLMFTVEDDSTATVTSFIVFLINNAPGANDFTVTTPEDTDYVFTLADFAAGYADVEDDALTHIVIGSLPAEGLLLLDGDTVRLGDEIRTTALDSGQLVLVPERNANGNPYTSFLFRVKDERAATSELYVASVIITPVSDPPAVDTVRVSGEENETIFFTAADFIRQFSDPENDTLTLVKIESLPDNGILLLNNEPVAIGDEIAVGLLRQLSFVPNVGFDGATQFQWNGYDGTAYAERSAPVIITLAEDNRIAALNDTIRLVDVITYEGTLEDLVVNPTGGDFIFSTTLIVATQHGTIRLREDGTYTYQTTEDFAGTDSFTFEVCNTNVPRECAQATVTILVAAPLLVYEGFSPDNDGTNDVWRIRGIENYPNNHIRIFNRWGNLVFEIEGYNNQDRAWSSFSTAGLVTGDVPDGTYFYLIDLRNGESPRSGYVIVNR